MPETAIAQTPYVRARQEWDERFGDQIKSKNNWRLAAFISMGTTLICVTGMVAIGYRSNTVPYVVALDDVGRAVPVIPAKQVAVKDVRLQEAVVARWITDLRTVVTDAVAERRLVDDVYAQTGQNSPASATITEFYSKNSPFDLLTKQTVDASVDSIVQQSPKYTLQLHEVSGDDDPHFDSKVFLAPGDKAAKDRLTDLPVFVPASELDNAKQEVAAAKAAQASELKDEEAKVEQYRSQYPGNLHFDYTWDQSKGKALGLQQIWRDDKFTYLRGQFQETPALYELKDGKGSLINFDFNAGLYTVPKQLDNGYGCLFSLIGRDEESLTDLELEAQVRSIEGALRGLQDGSCLYQYTRVMSGFDLPRAAKYTNQVTEVFASTRLTFLERTASFRRIDLHWCLTLEPSKVNAFERKPAEHNIDTSRMLAELEKTATRLQGHLGSSLGLRLLNKLEAFQFFSYLFNLEDWAEQDQLRCDEGVDRQIVKNPVAWHSDHLQVGKRQVQMFSLKATPEASRPCLFSGLLTLDCDSVFCSSWRVKSTSAARSEIDSQEKFISFFKVGVLTRVMSGRDTASLETGAGAKAANNSVDDLSEVIRSLDKKAQGEYSLRLLLAARSPEQLRDAIPAVHRAFVDARAQVMEETLGNLSAFYAMFPGNHKFNVFPLWLAEDHHARLSSVFAPHIGHPRSEDLDSEYLNIFETRTRTPFFQDVYVDGVRVMLIIGPTGTGKSVHGNQIIALEQKYGGFTYIFDIGGSYESVVELYGGRVDRVGKDGPRVNPFALEPTESNVKFLYSFIKLLLTNGGAALEPEDDDVIHKAVQDMYLLDAENRRLSNLFLPKKLDRYLSKWVGKGIYNAIFDNVEDSLSLSPLQCFDFQGVNNEQYADLIEPLMVWLLRRINDVLYNPANLGVPKHILIEEIFSSMKNKQLLEGALASIKTVRKNLGGVTMIGQSADDLGENADSIVNSCTSFLFLKDATFNRKRYAELFKMNEQQIALFESLQDREALCMRRDGITKVVTLNLDSRSYAAFSTKPKDRVRRSKLIAKYGLTEGIDRFAQGETV